MRKIAGSNLIRVKLEHSHCIPNREPITDSSIGAPLAPMTSQNGGQDGRHGSKMAVMAPIQAQIRVTTSDDPVTRSVSPRKVS